MAELVERAYVRGCSSSQMADWSGSLLGDQPDSFNLLVRLAASRTRHRSKRRLPCCRLCPDFAGVFRPGRQLIENC